MKPGAGGRAGGLEAHGEAGGQKAVVEALVLGQDRTRLGLDVAGAEDLAADRVLPEKHLEHHEADVEQQDERDEGQGEGVKRHREGSEAGGA
jgi:hypothetical protein